MFSNRSRYIVPAILGLALSLPEGAKADSFSISGFSSVGGEVNSFSRQADSAVRDQRITVATDPNGWTVASKSEAYAGGSDNSGLSSSHLLGALSSVSATATNPFRVGEGYATADAFWNDQLRISGSDPSPGATLTLRFNVFTTAEVMVDGGVRNLLNDAYVRQVQADFNGVTAGVQPQQRRGRFREWMVRRKREERLQFPIPICSRA